MSKLTNIAIMSALGIAIALFVVDIITTSSLSHELKQIPIMQKNIQDLQSRVNMIQGIPPLPVDTSVVMIPKDSSNQSCAGNFSCFSPFVIRIEIGTSVSWVNNDTSSHTVTSGKPSDTSPDRTFDSGLIKSGDTWSYRFTQEGTYNYYCAVHPWQTGQVIVEKQVT